MIGGETRQAIRAASILAAVVIAVVLLGLALDVAHEARAHVSDRLFPRGAADDRVVVVGLDHELVSASNLGKLTPGEPLYDPSAYDGGLLWARVLHSVANADPEVILLDTYRFGSVTEPDGGVRVLEGALRSAGNVYLAARDVVLRAPRAGNLPQLATAPATSDLLVAASAGLRVGYATYDPPRRPIRTAPLVVEREDGRLASSLALQGLMSLEGLRPSFTEHAGGIEVDGRYVPTEDATMLRVSYPDELLPGGRGVVSALDVVDGRVGPGRLRGKAVIVGITDPAAAAMVPTTVGGTDGLASPLFQAAALHTMLAEDYLGPVPLWGTLLIVAFVVFTFGIVSRRVSLWLTPVPALVLAALVWPVAVVAFDAGWVVDVLPVWVACALALFGVVIQRGLEELRARRRVAQLFSQYVPETVARELIAQERAEQAAAGERADVSVLFCDLRGFTRLAGSLEPPQVRDLLNVYYRHAARVILGHDGTVMQYVGDEVFAVFGAPLPDPAHRQRALACARDLQAAADDIAAELGGTIGRLVYGIGLHSGEVVAAHVGDDRRRQYAVVGDVVNVGARLCSMAGAGEIVASDQVLAQDYTAAVREPIEPGTLKGVDRELHVYRIGGRHGGDAAAPTAPDDASETTARRPVGPSPP